MAIGSNPVVRIGAASSRVKSLARAAARAESASGTSAAKVVLSIRASMLLAGSRLASWRATACSMRSPPSRPSAAFTSLKWMSSITSRLVGRSGPCSAILASSASRVGSPVSGSLSGASARPERSWSSTALRLRVRRLSSSSAAACRLSPASASTWSCVSSPGLSSTTQIVPRAWPSEVTIGTPA